MDVWQCDALGIYSDVQDGRFNTIGQKFLRGYQFTDVRGEAQFVTLYPGWYSGRTVHIHFKIRTTPKARRSFEFTSQLYFDDELTDRVHAATPYAARGPRTARNRHDGIFRRGGDQLMLAPSAASTAMRRRSRLACNFLSDGLAAQCETAVKRMPASA